MANFVLHHLIIPSLRDQILAGSSSAIGKHLVTHRFWNEKAIRKDVRFRPLLAASRANFPHALVLAAEFDLPRLEGDAYRDKLEHSDISVTYQHADGAVHGCFSVTHSQTHSQEAHTAIQSFIHNLRK